MKLVLHRTLVARLLTAWLLLSALVGGWVYYVELQEIDEVILDMAEKEAAVFSGAFLRTLHRPSLATESSLERYADDLLQQNYLVVELYDAQRQPVLKRLRDSAAEIERALSRTAHAFPSADNVIHEKHLLDGRYILRCVLPLLDRPGVVGGYFEGVYEVDEDTLDIIQERAYVSVLLTTLAILVTTLLMYPVIIALNRHLLRLSNDLLIGNVELMRVLGSAIAMRDSDTNTHNYRVTIYAIRLGEALNLPNGEMRKLIAGAFLHDVGKIGIADAILLKGTALTAEEIDAMHAHVRMGVDIISQSQWLQAARDVIEFHHEHFDGSGYTKGLRGQDIPLNARIFAVADVFDALTSRRVYKEAWTPEDALARIDQESGRQFDPEIVAVFRKIIPDLHAELARADTAQIERILNRLIEKHFYVSV